MLVQGARVYSLQDYVRTIMYVYLPLGYNDRIYKITSIKVPRRSISDRLRESLVKIQDRFEALPLRVKRSWYSNFQRMNKERLSRKAMLTIMRRLTMDYHGLAVSRLISRKCVQHVDFSIFNLRSFSLI